MEYTIKNALKDAGKVLTKGLGKFLVIIVTVLFASVAWYFYSLTPVNFTAKSIFYPDKEATMSGSPLELLSGGPAVVMNKAGALGILSKVFDSRSMTKIVVSHKLDSASSKHGEKLLADLIIEDNNKKYKPWQAKDNLEKMSTSSRIERAAAIIRAGCFAIIDENGFMSLTTKANDKDLALTINRVMIQELIKFNYDKKTEKAIADLHFISNRLDSVTLNYEALKYKSANFADANKYMIKQTVRIPLEDIDEQKKIVSARYLRLMDLQDQALMRLQADKPVIQILDAPYISLTTHPSTSGAAIIYGLIGFLLSVLYILRNVILRFVRAEIARSKNKDEEESSTAEVESK